MLHDRLLKEQLNFLLLVTRCYVSGHMLHSQYLPFLWDKETEKSKEKKMEVECIGDFKFISVKSSCVMWF